MTRREKNKKRIAAGIVTIIILILLLLLLSLRITDVTVSGSNQYTKEEIEQMIFDAKWSRNPVYCYLQHQFKPHKTIPFVEDYEIVFRSPKSVEIIVYEKSVVGYVTYMSSNMYFDKDGIIVESTNEKLDGIPLVTGLKFGHIVLHQPLPVENRDVFEETLNLTQILSIYGIKVDKIHYNSHSETELTIHNLEVKLGDNSEINGKISELNDILADYSDLNGTLYLDTYEETNTNPMFRFEPGSP